MIAFDTISAFQPWPTSPPTVSYYFITQNRKGLMQKNDLNARAKRFVDLDMLDSFFDGIDNFVEYVDKM